MKKKIICVDLDGVILSYKKGWLGEGKFGKPISGAKIGLELLRKNGWWVIVYTCRGNRKQIQGALGGYGIKKGVHYDAINKRKNVIPGTNKGKCGADVYLDDRSVSFNGDWGVAYAQVMNFKPWEQRGRKR